jgi:preprotein translocase subunit YajC
MLQALILFALEQQAEEPAWWQSPMLPILAIGFLFLYFMMILPERQRRKQQQAMMSSLKVKDKVVTIGGIVGVISSISDTGDELTLRLEEGKMRVLKSSVLRVLGGAEEPAPAETAIKK